MKEDVNCYVILRGADVLFWGDLYKLAISSKRESLRTYELALSVSHCSLVF